MTRTLVRTHFTPHHLHLQETVKEIEFTYNIFASSFCLVLGLIGTFSWFFHTLNIGTSSCFYFFPLSFVFIASERSFFPQFFVGFVLCRSVDSLV